jgi:thioredoxin reductase
MADVAPVLHADVAIVGAGPAGMAAAIAVARAGLIAVVLDEGHRAGGQIFRQLPAGFAHPAGTLPEPPSHGAGHELLERIARTSVRIERLATVWDAKPGRLWFEQDGRSRLLRCRAILLATGAYDRCVPFPGWTLPGVITAGACQVLVRGFAVKPGSRALVAGSGPLLLPTITALLSAGVEVAGALEASPRTARRSAAFALLRSRSKLREAAYYGRLLLRRRVHLQWGMTVFAAEGEGRVRRAIVGAVDREGRPQPDTARKIDVDLVCAGFGLIPSIELGLLLGCEAQHREARGGWHLRTDANAATSVAGVWAAGEVAGIGGSDVAIAEGQLAGAAILHALRGAPVSGGLLRARARARRSADALLSAFAPLPGLAGLCREDTVVCRCEDVRAGELRAAAALHGFDVRGIKMGTRAGMGPCQGRICGPCLQAVASPGASVRMDCPVAQVPVKPVAVRTLLDAPAG